jgi:uncharacterized protein (DUF2141 family)
MKNIILIALLLILVLPRGICQTDSTANITVEITGLRSSEGKVGISLFNSEEGFPGDSDRAIERAYIDIQNQSAIVIFENLAPGKYAIAVYHDEDEDGEIETNFIGIPKEGTGSSNNPKARMGPPRYEDCKFDIAVTNYLKIEMKYF